jgi:hypothetical protein
MKSRVRKWVLFAVRCGIAVVGIWYVWANISWRDRVLVLDERNRPVEYRLAESVDDAAAGVTILEPYTHTPRAVPRDRLVNEADRPDVPILRNEQARKVTLLALDLTDDIRNPSVRRLLIADPSAADPQTASGIWIEPGQVVGGYALRVPYPLVQAGLRHMLIGSDPAYLWLAVLIFPITFVITGLRWYSLLKILQIDLGAGRAMVLNMVGAFYNTFMPGSTGGDLLKAYYAAKHAPNQRTGAVMSVLVDRVIGLVALVILGGTMAAMQWTEPACRQVAIASGAVVVLLGIGLTVFYHPALRRWTGMAFVLQRLPLQRQVAKAVQTMEIYRTRPWTVLGTLVATFPVHATVVISAMLAGKAFGLPLSPLYYWVVVPVVVLSGSIPISPQGAGVMEFFAILLTRSQGATVAQAFALTMSIRLVQILWNLTGGIFVLRGGYQAPTESEQRELVNDAPAGDSVVAPVGART